MMVYIDEYIYYLICQRHYSQNTIITYKHNLFRFIKFLCKIQVYQFDHVKIKHIENFVADLHHKGLSASSKNHAIAIIKSFFKYLKKEEVIRENYANEVDLAKVPFKIPEILNHEEIEIIFESIQGNSFNSLRKKLILELLYGSGLRASELCAVKINDVCLEGMVIKILGKGNKERIVPITSRFVDAYNNFLCERKKKLPYDHNHYLFINVRGKGQMNRISVWHQVKSIIDKTNIKKAVSPHTFRHSFASHLLIGGAPLIVIQQMLGHSCISTTQIYIHLDIRELQKSFDKFHPRFD